MSACQKQKHIKAKQKHNPLVQSFQAQDQKRKEEEEETRHNGINIPKQMNIKKHQKKGQNERNGLQNSVYRVCSSPQVPKADVVVHVERNKKKRIIKAKIPPQENRTFFSFHRCHNKKDVVVETWYIECRYIAMSHAKISSRRNSSSR